MQEAEAQEDASSIACRLLNCTYNICKYRVVGRLLRWSLVTLTSWRSDPCVIPSSGRGRTCDLLLTHRIQRRQRVVAIRLQEIVASVLLADPLYYLLGLCTLKWPRWQGTEGSLRPTVCVELNLANKPCELASRTFPSWALRWIQASWCLYCSPVRGLEAEDPAQPCWDFWPTDTVR